MQENKERAVRNMPKDHSRKKQFEQIYAEHYVRLYYYALHLVNDENLCKDILNDVFAALWKNLNDIQVQSLNAYLATAVRHRTADLLRHSQQKVQYSEDYIYETEVFYSEYTAEDDLLVQQMLKQLPPPTDKILKMCYLDQMKYAEVAEALHVSTSTVKKHITKALKTLREIYKDKKDTRFS